MKRGAVGGFTIVETMIVLAISGVLFISMVGVVQGQQNKMQFKNSMTDVVSQVQSVIGQVSSGTYPIAGASFACQAGSNGTDIVPRISTSWEAGTTGSNDDCTFIGQAVMFGVCTFQDTERYAVQTLVGLRRTPAGESPANFNETKVKVMAPGSSPSTVFHSPNDRAKTFNPLRSFASVAPAPDDDGCGGTNPTGGTPNYGVIKSLSFGTTIKWMRYDNVNDDTIPLAGFAIVTSPNAVAAGGGTDESGALLTNIIPIECGVIPVPTCTTKGTDQANGVDAITDRFKGSNGVNATARGMKLCFLSGTTNQSSLVRVGANGGTNSLEMTIHNNLDCA